MFQVYAHMYGSLQETNMTLHKKKLNKISRGLEMIILLVFLWPIYHNLHYRLIAMRVRLV